MDTQLTRWRPHTTALLVIGVVLIIIASVIAYIATNFRPTTEARISANVYHLWVADDEVSRVTGLSGVEELKPNGGLLMTFETDDLHSIWMNEMEIPIDIVWLDSSKKVVYVVTDAQPDQVPTATFTPRDKARYVLELPAGSVKQDAMRIGDTIEFDESARGFLW